MTHAARPPLAPRAGDPEITPELVEEHGPEGAWQALAGQSPFGRFATPD